MSSLPRPPASCADLDLAVVERTLAKHYGDITGAARKLGVSGPDLKRLTWAKPQLLEEADLERMGVISQVWHVLIAALDSDDRRRKMWASDRIMSSWIARDHPLAPARRRSTASVDVNVQNNKTVNYTFRGRNSDDDKPDAEAAPRPGEADLIARYFASLAGPAGLDLRDDAAMMRR
jgi:hypothetical protein